ncbi:hypothetical protein CORC01_13427 [Colletotrichum orchidophilum]|uniref:Uncharacterized protein n=1 Tax=Colletotrichum orchidophilum TaxID=1209926 RepID=A0A1G4AQ21_9PEZI|nr:uncharacterized protein CORC01_13427 [Colletotrichum orchidophilum]OHE91269.1 hypothetical protein CORC01_13427 [Colletotrichum orchidophilum]
MCAVALHDERTCSLDKGKEAGRPHGRNPIHDPTVAPGPGPTGTEENPTERPSGQSASAGSQLRPGRAGAAKWEATPLSHRATLSPSPHSAFIIRLGTRFARESNVLSRFAPTIHTPTPQAPHLRTTTPTSGTCSLDHPRIFHSFLFPFGPASPPLRSDVTTTSFAVIVYTVTSSKRKVAWFDFGIETTGL